MIRSIVLILAVCAAAGSAAAQPADIRVASYEMSETGGVVMLESNAPIGEPWLRIDGQGVRIWFPEVSEVSRFDHARDARDPIRSLQLRPGASESAVLRLELGAGRKLSRDDIEVTRAGQTARVEVAFAPRPRLSAPVPAAAPAPQPAAAARPQPQPLAAAAKPLQLNGAATATAVPTVQAASKPPQDAASSPSTQQAGAPVHTLATVASNAAGVAPGLGLATGGNANLGGLIALSGLLCAVYLAIRAYGKKKRSALGTDIQVLSAHRLGHRSELMVVRALGADHLLVSSAGRVERVASVPTPAEPLALAPPLAAPPAPEGAPDAAAIEASQANGLGIISKLSSSYRVKKLLDAVDRESPDPAETEPVAVAGRQSFGPELMSAINQHKFVNLSALPPLTAKQSDAVAGIARLRGRAN